MPFHFHCPVRGKRLLFDKVSFLLFVLLFPLGRRRKVAVVICRLVFDLKLDDLLDYVLRCDILALYERKKAQINHISRP